MALADPLTVSPTTPTAGTGSDVDFAVVGRGTRDTSRLNDATTLSDPEYFNVKHNISGTEKGGDLTDRHLVQLSRVERDSDGAAHTCVLNLSIVVPRNGLFSEAEVLRQVSLLTNFLLGSGNLGAVLQGQS
jgi:hypothetical protein